MTKVQFRILYRAFLFRVVDLELLSSSAQGDSNTLLGQFAALLLIVSTWVLTAVAGAAGGNPRLPEPVRLIDGWPAQHTLIATTMLIVGLFAVASWDSNFPNRRDVLVLAPLPIRIRILFLAKVAASASALVLAILIPNALPSLTWTLAATPSSRGILSLILTPGLYRSFGAYWLTMIAAGGFVFSSVLSVQGLGAQLLPRRRFLQVSGLLQLSAFGLFVCGYFLLPQLATPVALAAERNQPILAWLPSYWFLGLLQQLNGSMHPVVVPLARRAWIGLALVSIGMSATYALSYQRTLRKIVEEPDILPASRRGMWLPQFGNAFETAITHFSLRTLFRSRQHRLILAFYLGVAFATTMLFLKTPVARHQMFSGVPGAWRQVSIPLLTSSIVLMIAWVVGMKVAFSIPIELRANWIFRIIPTGGAPACLAARRRTLMVLAVMPAWAMWAGIFAGIWLWRPAAGHILILAVLGVALTELCLQGVQKIPFACSYLPGRSNFHITFWFSIILFVMLIDYGATFELTALDSLPHYLSVVGVLILSAFTARWQTTTRAHSDGAEVRFEEEPEPAVMQLGLGRDGAPTTGR